MPFIQPGRVVIGASFVILALVYSVWYSFPVFFVAILNEFGWSRSLAAGAFSVFVILQSLIAPFSGAMTDRLGPRKVIVAGTVVLALGLVLCSLVRTWWQFYLFYGIVAAIGVGTSGWVSNLTMIQSWFREQKGLAVGIVASGIGIGMLVCVPLVQYLINRVGWRSTYRTMALLIPFAIVCLAAAFLKKPSQGTTLRLGGKKTPSQAFRASVVVDEAWASRSWTVARAIRTKQFWLLGFAAFSGNAVTHSVLTHQVAFFVDQGLEALFASYIAGLVGLVSMGGKILWGTLSDRIGREITQTLGTCCSVCGFLFLILIQSSSAPFLPYLYVLFFGLGYAVTAALPPLIAADFFEGPAFGRIFGTLMLVLGFGGAFGAWFPGFIYDRFGTYLPALIAMMVSAPLTSLSVWMAAPGKIRRVPGRVHKQTSMNDESGS